MLDIVAADPILTIRDTDTGVATANATLRLGESTTGPVLDNYWDVVADNTAGNFGFAIKQKISNNTNTRFVIAPATGNIGIGTDAPAQKLDVRDGDLILSSSNAGNAHRTSFIEFTGSYARINSVANQGSTGSSNYAAGWNFTTRNYTGSAFETLTPFTIQANGNVGINDSSPSSQLVVKAKSDDNPALQLYRQSTGGDIASIIWQTGSGTQAKINYRGAAGANEGMQFYTAGGSSSQLRMIIDHSGNIGIGTNNPTGKLHLADTLSLIHI